MNRVFFTESSSNFLNHFDITCQRGLEGMLLDSHRIADDIDHVTIYELLVTIKANEYKIYYYMEYVIKHSITSNIIT